jgi:hypothetical protein
LSDDFELSLFALPEEQLAVTYATGVNPELEFVEQVML